jgi:putative toxin-antitoxin system antitoxin component (TIGR02293 family)
VLRIPARTLARRKHQRRLSPEESDRLFRLSRVATLTEDVLGGRPRATAWLQAANRELGGATPLSRLDTDLGAEEVEAVLLRLSYGVVG